MDTFEDYKICKQNPLEKFFIFTIYQNYTLAWKHLPQASNGTLVWGRKYKQTNKKVLGIVNIDTHNAWIQ